MRAATRSRRSKGLARRADASGAARVRRTRRVAMRLLHARNGDVGDRGARRNPAASSTKSSARSRGIPAAAAPIRMCSRRRSRPRGRARGERLMAQRVTLNLGFEGGTREVTVVIPDDEPTPWQWGEQFRSSGSRLRAWTVRSRLPGSRATLTMSICPGCFTARSCAARIRMRACVTSTCRRAADGGSARGA